MDAFTGVVEIVGKGKFFGSVVSISGALEAALELQHTDFIEVSGVRGKVGCPASMVINPTVTNVCPWDAVDLTVPVAG